MQTNDYTKATLTEWQKIVLFLPLIISLGSLYAMISAKDMDSYYYYANSIFLLSAAALPILEYLWLDLKNAKIRWWMLWIMFLNSSFLILAEIAPDFPGYILSLVFVPVVLILTFRGQQPNLLCGRLTPLFMKVIGSIWNFNYIFRLMV